ncbi:hypothetical protein LIA77_09671 [Sarocladium implicatum]|nr:hypothetical protein LIA77_09671 [Sarocladium implicatum]
MTTTHQLEQGIDTGVSHATSETHVPGGIAECILKRAGYHRRSSSAFSSRALRNNARQSDSKGRARTSPVQLFPPGLSESMQSG